MRGRDLPAFPDDATLIVHLSDGEDLYRRHYAIYAV